MNYDTSAVKKPIELFKRKEDGTEELVAWACGECGVVVSSTHQEAMFVGPDAALQHCAPHLCDCGDPIKEGYYTSCSGCREELDRAKDADRLAKAKKVSLSGVEQMVCDCCDHFYSDERDLFDDHFDSGRELPTFAWTCREEAFSLSAGDVVGNRLEELEFSDECEYHSKDAVAELDVALREWCAKHPEKNWFSDRDEVVDLSDARAQWLEDRTDETEDTEEAAT